MCPTYTRVAFIPTGSLLHCVDETSWTSTMQASTNNTTEDTTYSPPKSLLHAWSQPAQTPECHSVNPRRRAAKHMRQSGARSWGSRASGNITSISKPCSPFCLNFGCVCISSAQMLLPLSMIRDCEALMPTYAPTVVE